MNKQTLLFDNASEDTDKKYTKKIAAPVYEPSHQKPHLINLCNPTKTMALIREINESSLPEDEKEFLRKAAHRHSVFHYERIADYYAHSSPEAQRLMEKSALVIIDFDKAIELGFVKLCSDIREQFMEEFTGDEKTEKQEEET